MPRTCYRKRSGSLAGRQIAAAALLGFSLCLAGGAAQESPCVITTVAGMVEYFKSHGDGGPATEAHLDAPEGLAFDGAGNLYIADAYNHRVRKVDAFTGVITTVAGTGRPTWDDRRLSGPGGYSGDGGPATKAQLDFPADLAFDATGNLYIADRHNHRVRKVDARTGVITTVAGTGVQGFSGDGGPATEAQFGYPEGLAIDCAGNLYIADAYNHRVRKVDAFTGVITTVAGTGEIAHGGYRSDVLDEDGGPATEAEIAPKGLAFDGAGDLYIADMYHDRVRKVDAFTGVITTVAGTGEVGFDWSADRLTSPVGLAFDGAGNLYLSSIHRVRKVDMGCFRRER